MAAVEQEIDRAAPPGAVPTYTVASIIETKAERAVRPESIALAVFGAIVALALLLIAGPVIGRQLRRDGNDLHVLRALGAGPTMTASDGLIGVTAAILSARCWPCSSPWRSRRSLRWDRRERSIRIRGWPSTGRSSGSAPWR